ncbi:ArsC/Spx/MgsR family protein [Roseibacterium sp. SDUM158017]|uniref:arsenate reductase family protein n=1 Tax=Roseicyclus salinarum TaxID=3036773 RepID=UPI0024155A6A|nr:ArsC/Spx/MgsR family protein [Roseibacterium sp. SDUM158017]MDG4649145.1 ArsC/Spx/MgsR family protein [Roseibacterium sp. SDUM158017]
MILYGLKTCDTCRKALGALKAAGREVEFVDVRETPLDAAMRERLLQAFGDRAVNTRSTTWRGLSEAERAAPADALLAAHPTLMKRPVIDAQGTLHLGWDAAVRAALL